MMNNTRIPRNKIVTVNNIEKIYKTFVKETNECLSDLRKEDYNKFYNGYSMEIDMLERDIIKHGRLLDYLKNNHKQFKKDLGTEQFNDDTIEFKRLILQSQFNLNYCKKKLL